MGNSHRNLQSGQEVLVQTLSQWQILDGFHIPWLNMSATFTAFHTTGHKTGCDGIVLVMINKCFNSLKFFILILTAMMGMVKIIGPR